MVKPISVEVVTPLIGASTKPRLSLNSRILKVVPLPPVVAATTREAGVEVEKLNVSALSVP